MIKKKALHSFVGVALGLLLGFIIANLTGVKVIAVAPDINDGELSFVDSDEGKVFSAHTTARRAGWRAAKKLAS